VKTISKTDIDVQARIGGAGVPDCHNPGNTPDYPDCRIRPVLVSGRSSVCGENNEGWKVLKPHSLKASKAFSIQLSGSNDTAAKGNIRSACTYPSMIVRKTTKKIVPTTLMTMKMESHSSQVIS
jgi:hypothetical protein